VSRRQPSHMGRFAISLLGSGLSHRSAIWGSTRVFRAGKNARERAADAWQLAHGTEAPQGFRRVRVHDLKHTFGRRLRAAGVSFEDRQDLLGHKSQRITTHYSEAELANLIAAAEKACETKSRNPLCNRDGRR
jgi:integrase